MAFRKFWVVRESLPLDERYSLEEAKDEAKRLSREWPGWRFVVLEAVGSVITKKPETLWEDDY